MFCCGALTAAVIKQGLGTKKTLILKTWNVCFSFWLSITLYGHIIFRFPIHNVNPASPLSIFSFAGLSGCYFHVKMIRFITNFFAVVIVFQVCSPFKFTLAETTLCNWFWTLAAARLSLCTQTEQGWTTHCILLDIIDTFYSIS